MMMIAILEYGGWKMEGECGIWKKEQEKETKEFHVKYWLSF